MPTDGTGRVNEFLNMRKLYSFFLCMCLLSLSFYGCKTDTDDIWDSIHKLDDRVASLEEICKRMNGNINALQILVEAVQDNNSITKVVPVLEHEVTIGYTIHFTKGEPITIYHGKNGEAGGNAPVIGVKEDEDGIYYWTLNGEWLTDDEGKKIRAIGRDGQDGADGKPGEDGKPGQDGKPGEDGKDGITPQLKIENGRWLLSMDNGQTWTDAGQATGEAGKDGESMFSDITINDKYVVFTLKDGTEIKLPTLSAFEALENKVNQMNADITNLQSIVTALQDHDYITKVTPVVENGKEIGYMISFAKSASITIYHGEKGDKGDSGQDGNDGKDGVAPVIGVRQENGVYYWTLDGEWLLDKSGQKILATGRDGEDGKPGQDGKPGEDGKDGITPQLKIENGRWLLSMDNGLNWKDMGQATGDSGAKGDSMFSDIDTSNANYVKFTLADGTVIELPTKIAFEALEQKVNQLNTDIYNLQSIVTGLQNNDYITSVAPVVQNGEEIGYTISFSKGTPITIYHGKKGDTGEAGKDGLTPVIGVKQENGIYYWTLDGKFILDEQGNKIKAEGRDGSDGNDGTAGKDGITPKLKIENGDWYLSVDSGSNWSYLGKATGDKGDMGPAGESLFQNVINNESSVTFILQDGTEIVLPKYVAFSITFSELKDYQVAPGKTIEIGFTVTGVGNDWKLNVMGGSKSSVEFSSTGNGAVTGKIKLITSLEERVEEIMIFAKCGQQNSWESFSVTTNYALSEIGDIYYQSGKPIGIIWKKRSNSVGAKDGMVISGLESSNLSWYTGGTGEPSPAVWVKEQFGVQWFVPSVDELVLCFQTISDYGWNLFDDKMETIGFGDISKTLWSNTKGTTGVYCVQKLDNSIEKKDISTGQGLHVRAMRYF